MKKNFLFATLFLYSSIGFAQTILHRDPEIENMVTQISRDSLKSYIEKMVSFDTRSTMSTQTSKKKGIGAARNYVLSKFQQFAKNSNGRMTAYLDKTTLEPDGKRVNRKTVLGNVMAVLKGANPKDNRTFIISGHLDSRRSNVMDSVKTAPGANDDGSGVAMVMELARVMSSHSFNGTIIFVAVSGEEQGLLGSQFLADKAKKENWNVVAMLNNDMVGSDDSSGTLNNSNMKFRVFSEGISHFETEKALRRILSMGLENEGASRQLARYFKETAERYVDNTEIILEYRTDRFLRGGDHMPFLNNGFPAIRLTEMYENYDHTHQDIRKENGIQFGDLIQFVDFEYLRKNSGSNLATLANLAKSPGAPQNVKIEVRELTNYTTLHWDAPKNNPVSGYYILMRPTAEPMWTKKIFTRDQKIILPYSKDNYFFAVQSVSADGNESLPAIPFPG